MNFKIKECGLQQIREKMMTSINERISYIDSFLEEHIIKSKHYEILLDSRQIGYFSIHKGSLLTQFYMDKEFRHLSQQAFEKVRRFDHVEKAFVPTNDEFFLSHIFDYARKTELQAYFFEDSGREMSKDKILDGFTCRLAVKEDINLIREKAENFFDDIERHVEEQQIYIGYLNQQVVSFGIVEKSVLYENVASIGMMTVSDKRQSGIGRNTILQLKDICYKKGITPIAGCWYYNHNSKKTLESAGMFAQTRLLLARL